MYETKFERKRENGCVRESERKFEREREGEWLCLRVRVIV